MNNHVRRHGLLAAILLMTCGTSLQAADWAVPRGPSREPVPFRYDAAQWRQVPAEFLDDASACILYAGSNYLVEADGTVETVIHEVARLNSRKAIQSLGEYRSIYYSPAHENLTLNEARVHKADGRIVPVEARHLRLRDVGTDFLVYDDGKQLVISFPSLEVGDAIEVKWTTRGKNPEHQGHFFTRYTFGADEHPVATDELRVTLPRERPLKYAAIGTKLEPQITEAGGLRTYHWQTTNRRQLPLDEHLPSKEELRWQVAVSTFPSWEAVFQWKQQLRQDCWTCTPELRRLVAEVTRDLKTPLEKAQALTYWVRRHIRYVSAGEKHDYTPHAPAQVVNTRYGDCKDSSQLLAVLLRELGLEIALVSLSSRGDGQVLETVPSPWATHAILLVVIDGKQHWIDTTARLAGWDQLPRDDCDRVCYVVFEKGLQVLRTPALKPEDNRTDQTTRLTIGADGSTRGERTVAYHGLAALNRRYDWVEVPSGENRRQLTAELQDAQSKSRLNVLRIDEDHLRQHHLPVQAHFVYEVLDHFGASADQAGQRDGSLTDSPVWSNLLYLTLDYDRKVPLVLDAPFEARHRYTIELPPYFRLDSAVKNKAVRSQWGFFQLTATEHGDGPTRLDLDFHTRIDKVRVEPADFDAFRQFHEEVLKSYRVWLTLKPAKDLSAAPLLEALVRLTPGDSAAAELLAELYLDNRQDEQARAVLHRARHFHPGSARLGELAIQAAATRPEAEAIYRALMKQHPDQLRYPLELAANLVEQGKHTEARATLKPVLKQGSPTQQSQGHFELARASFRDKKPAQALKHLDAALAADRETANTLAAWRLRADCCEQLKRPGEARTAYRQALELDGQATDVLEALVRLELAASQRVTALDYLRRLGAAVGADAGGLARVADYHWKLERSDDAWDYAKRSRDLANSGLAQRTLGLVCLQRRDYAKAAFHLERADLDADVLTALMRCRLALGQLHLALQDADQAGKIAQPTPALAASCQAVLDLLRRRQALLADARVPPDKRDDWTEAAGRLACAEYAWRNGGTPEEVAALLPDFDLGPAFALRGLLALEKGRLIRALDNGERAIALSPNQPGGYYVRGRVRLERGQADALPDLKKAADLSQRQDPRILHWLAAALAKDDQRAEALTVQRAAVQLQPKDAELAEQLRDLEKPAKAGP